MKYEIPFRSVQSVLFFFFTRPLVVFTFIVVCDHQKEHENYSLKELSETPLLMKAWKLQRFYTG